MGAIRSNSYLKTIIKTGETLTDNAEDNPVPMRYARCNDYEIYRQETNSKTIIVYVNL